MKVRVTITKVLDDELWGFSQLLSGREVKDAMFEIKELLQEDIYEVLDNAHWQIEEVRPTIFDDE